MGIVPSADLTGVIPVAPTAQGFVLPVFLAPRHSNARLVQVLASTSEVQAFTDFESDEAVVKKKFDETTNVGGEAIWAFQIAQDHFVISRASKFRMELFDELERNKLELSPYVQWEVERLFGHNDKRRAAVRKLHAAMAKWNAKWADYWLSTLFILPTIRQEIEQVALPNSDEEIANAIRALRVECSSKGVLLHTNPALLDWLTANNATFRTAMESAANEWRGTGIGTRWTLAQSSKTREPIPVRPPIRTIAPIAAKRRAAPLFKSAQILFDKSWSTYERFLGMNLIDEIARTLLVEGFDAHIEKLVTKSPPRTVLAYSARSVPPGSYETASTKPLAKAASHLTVLCGGDYRFLLGMFRRTPKSVKLRASDTNILLFRNREEAEETLTKLEGLTSQTRRISQVWITEPQVPSEQLELRYFSSPVFQDPKFIGYVSPSRGPFSLAKRLPELRGKDFFLVIADNQTVSEANIIARSMIATRASQEGGVAEVVICFVGGPHKTLSEKIPLPGVHAIIVDAPPILLLQRARAIFSALGPFSAGMFALTRVPLVFVVPEGRRIGSTSFAASMMGAATAEIYPASPLEKRNYTNIRRALKRASEELRYTRVARRRQASCQARPHAVELLEDLYRYQAF